MKGTLQCKTFHETLRFPESSKIVIFREFAPTFIRSRITPILSPYSSSSSEEMRNNVTLKKVEPLKVFTLGRDPSSFQKHARDVHITPILFSTTPGPPPVHTELGWQGKDQGRTLTHSFSTHTCVRRVDVSTVL